MDKGVMSVKPPGDANSDVVIQFTGGLLEMHVQGASALHYRT